VIPLLPYTDEFYSEFTESQASSISVDLDDTLSLPGSQNLEYESSELGDKTVSPPP
jgi:hypothetical protein